MGQLRVRLWSTAKEATDATEATIRSIPCPWGSLADCEFVRWDAPDDPAIHETAHVDADGWTALLAVPAAAEKFLRFALENQGYVKEVSPVPKHPGRPCDCPKEPR